MLVYRSKTTSRASLKTSAVSSCCHSYYTRFWASTEKDHSRELLSGFAQDPRVVGLVIVEVDAAPTNARLQDSGSGRGYYNLYFLIHDITQQRLMPRAFWERLFADCGFNLLAVEHISEKADPLRLEIVFLLEKG